MAVLESRFENPNTGQSITLTREIPLGRTFGLGKRPLTDESAPSWNRSEWVTPPDRFIHGRHAELHWDGQELRVRQRRNPEPVLNPILLHGRPTAEFTLLIGESFRIGDTWFTLRELERDEPIDSQSSSDMPDRVAVFAPKELRLMPYAEGSSLLREIDAICELIHFTADAEQLDRLLLDKILASLQTADSAAIVAIERGDTEATVYVRSSRQQNEEPFKPSRTLVRRVLRDELRNILYCRSQGNGDAEDTTAGPNVDWAICAPLGIEFDSRILGIYVAGRSSEPQTLQDYQKFIDFACQMYQSTYHRRRAESLVEKLGLFLPRPLVRVLESSDPLKSLSRREADVTVLFCDVRSFSRFTESGEGLATKWEQVSRALDVMTTAIEHEDGVVGDLQGDAVMGFWGWPDSDPDRIRRASRAALYIRREFAKTEHFRQCDFRCGIGLADGRAVVGALGTRAQRKLDAFGPVVNRASRLESLTKELGVPILVDAGVAAWFGSNNGSNPFAVRRIARVVPPGMSNPVVVHELLPPEEIDEPSYKHWEVAVRNFLELKNWEVARINLEKYERYRALAKLSADPAASLLYEFMEAHGFQPPPKWDGSIPMGKK